jgi:hypothetical protein
MLVTLISLKKKSHGFQMMLSQRETEKYFFFYNTMMKFAKLLKKKMDANFIGYSFKRDLEKERNALVSALENLE